MNTSPGLPTEFESIRKSLIKGATSLVILFICVFIVSGNLNGQENIEMIFPSEKTVDLSNDISMSYYKEGEGNRNILFIHGLGSNKKAWTNIFPFLSAEHTLYAIDLPKYLETDDVSGIGMRQYSDCVRLFMDKLNIDKAIICGHSMGGQIAVHFALDYPDRTDELILLAPAGLETFNENEVKWFETYVTKAFFLNQTDEQIKRNFEINFYENKIPENAAFMLSERLDLKKDTIRYHRYIDYVIASIQSMLNEPVYDALPKLEVRTLVVFGKNDLLIPNRLLHPTLQVEDVLKNVAFIPEAKTLLLDHTGHFVQWDQPKLISEKIKQFIQAK